LVPDYPEDSKRAVIENCNFSIRGLLGGDGVPGFSGPWCESDFVSDSSAGFLQGIQSLFMA
jgi:hypothetical protein